MTVVVAVLALAAIPAPSKEPASQRIAASKATGKVKQSNSREGSAIFSAREFAPGDLTSGSVVIANRSKRTGHFVLAQGLLENRRGYFRGLLSAQLDLRLWESRRSGRRLVYDGKLGSLRPMYLGVFKAREERTYRFDVSFPRGGRPPSAGAGDNRFMGSAVRIGYDWTAYDRKPDLRKYVSPRLRGPQLKISTKRLQDILRRRRLKLRVTCPGGCRIVGRIALRSSRSASGRLAGFKRAVPSTRARTFTVTFSPKARRRIRSSFRKRRVARIALEVTATNAAGAKTIKRVRINLKPVRR